MKLALLVVVVLVAVSVEAGRRGGASIGSKSESRNNVHRSANRAAGGEEDFQEALGDVRTLGESGAWTLPSDSHGLAVKETGNTFENAPFGAASDPEAPAVNSPTGTQPGDVKHDAASNGLYLHDEDNMRCLEASATDHTVQNVEECIQTAVDQGKQYFSYHKSGKCRISDTCFSRERKSDWKIFVAWSGAYNDTHMDPVPEHSGSLTADASASGCLTQKTVHLSADSISRASSDGGGLTRRDKLTCTSCKQGQSLAMIWHKSRAGACRTFRKDHIDMICASLGVEGAVDIEDVNKICTKTNVVEQVIYPTLMASQPARTHFAAAAGGFHNVAIVHCDVRKEAACMTGKCMTRKQTYCNRVCKLKSWGPPRTVYDCSDTMCEGYYGGLACANVANLS